MSVQDPRGCLAVLFKFLGFWFERPEVAPEPLPYRKKDYLLTRAEKAFFDVLEPAIRGHFHLSCKVRMADLLYIRKGTGSWQSFFNKINAKHIDFVLCDLPNVMPLLAIELDDSSHDKPDRIQRDEFVNQAFHDAGFPLLRIPVQRSYEKGTLIKKIQACIHQKGG